MSTYKTRRGGGGGAKGMDIPLHRSHPDLSWNIVNVIASDMPAKAKTWDRITNRRVIKSIARPQTPGGEAPSSPPR